MKKLFVGAAALLALGVAPALAADMPVKARPAPVTIESAYNWTGFYIGLNAGYGTGHTSSNNDPADQASQNFFSDRFLTRL
jgi:outer membrane immunogenic protein